MFFLLILTGVNVVPLLFFSKAYPMIEYKGEIVLKLKSDVRARVIMMMVIEKLRVTTVTLTDVL